MLQTQISRTENGHPSTSSTKERPRKVNTDSGSLTKKQERKDSLVCIQKPNFGLLALRDHTLSANCTADHSRKENRRATIRKVKDQDPASARGQKVKVMQHGTMTSKTQLSGEKEQAKRARKEMKETGSFKGMPYGKEKAKVMARTKEENPISTNSLHKQM